MAAAGAILASALGPLDAGQLRAGAANAVGVARPLGVPAAAAQHQEFFWDFSDCYDYTITTTATEFVEGTRYNLPGGCFLRFGSPGQSSLQATFVLSGSPAASRPGDWTLTMFHLALAPDDRDRGYAPVRVTLNGQEVWQGSPEDEGVYGPGRVWDATEVDVTRQVQSGRNTLRWELLSGARSPYWLKVIHVGWQAQ